MKDYDAECRRYHNLFDLSVDELRPGDCHFSIGHCMQHNWTSVIVSIVKRESVIDVTWIECNVRTRHTYISNSLRSAGQRFLLHIYRSSVQ